MSLRNTSGRYEELKKIIFDEANPEIDLDKVRELCFDGIESSDGLRSICWRLMMGYLSTNRKNWAKELKESREFYYDFIKELVLSIYNSTKAKRSKKYISIIGSRGMPGEKDELDYRNKAILQILRDVKRTLPNQMFFHQFLNSDNEIDPEYSGTKSMNNNSQTKENEKDIKDSDAPKIKKAGRSYTVSGDKNTFQKTGDELTKNMADYKFGTSKYDLESGFDSDNLRYKIGKKQSIAKGPTDDNRKFSFSKKRLSKRTTINSLFEHVDTNVTKNLQVEKKNGDVVNGKRGGIKDVSFGDLQFFAVNERYINKYKHEISELGLAKEFMLTPPQTHLDIIARILFVFTCLNKSVGYVQGMNEIVATFYYVMVNEAPTRDDRIAAEADTFYLLFNALNGQTLNNFISEMDEVEADLLEEKTVFDENQNQKETLAVMLDEGTSKVKNVEGSNEKNSGYKQVEWDIPTNNLGTNSKANSRDGGETVGSKLAKMFDSMTEKAYFKPDNIPAPDKILPKFPEKQGGIQRMLWRWWNKYVRSVDPELWEYMDRKGFKPEDFALRWLLVWCAREYDLKQVIRLWDSFISDRAGRITGTNSYVEFSEKDDDHKSDNLSEGVGGKKNGNKYSIKFRYNNIVEGISKIMENAEVTYTNQYEQYYDNHIGKKPMKNANKTIKSKGGEKKKKEVKKLESDKKEDKVIDKKEEKSLVRGGVSEMEFEMGFLLDFGVSMLVSVREKILKSDFSGGMMILQSFNQETPGRMGVEQLLEMTKLIKCYREKYGNNMPAVGIVDELKLSFEIEGDEKSGNEKIRNTGQRGVKICENENSGNVKLKLSSITNQQNFVDKKESREKKNKTKKKESNKDRKIVLKHRAIHKDEDGNFRNSLDSRQSGYYDNNKTLCKKESNATLSETYQSDEHKLAPSNGSGYETDEKSLFSLSLLGRLKSFGDIFGDKNQKQNKDKNVLPQQNKPAEYKKPKADLYIDQYSFAWM
ncbi:hypothetical protein BB559_003369 [Furculomyces boomerangus]|uniref:Rab-GAP TBC domain-containing protein n=2 Tax=Harpellales TaxID=61421 RepID=A0A2T9YLQ5_9FUNG|nr:hypothetical protein BB559_003369 [Furculomyces boomerangus]PWA00430.1 hypothetical protein BB558_003524 [Smittium angustum]